MVRAAQVLAEAGRVDELAGTSSADPDWAVVARRVKQVSDGWDDTRAAERLAKTGATLLRGRGVITAPGNVYIDDQSFTAWAGLVIASGAEPAKGAHLFSRRVAAISLNVASFPTQTARMVMTSLTVACIVLTSSVPQRLSTTFSAPVSAARANTS